MQSFIHSFKYCLLISRTVLGTEDITVNKTDTLPALIELTIQWERQSSRQIHLWVV